MYEEDRPEDSRWFVFQITLAGVAHPSNGLLALDVNRHSSLSRHADDLTGSLYGNGGRCRSRGLIHLSEASHELRWWIVSSSRSPNRSV